MAYVFFYGGVYYRVECREFFGVGKYYLCEPLPVDFSVEYHFG